jgi:hypothetical protein
MSDEQAAGSGENTTPETPGASSSTGSELESKLAAARDEAAKNRIAKREASQAAEAAQKQAADAEKRLAAVMKAAGLEVSDDGGANVEAIQAAAAAKERKAQEALIRAEVKARALQAGVRPDKVDTAIKLVDFSAIDADLETLEISGVDEAVEAVLEELPELKTTNPNAAGVETRTPGKTKGGLDFSKLAPGDVTKMSPDEFAAFMATNPQIKTGRYVQNAQGELVPEVFDNPWGGNQLDRSLRRAKADKEAMEKALGDK